MDHFIYERKKTVNVCTGRTDAKGVMGRMLWVRNIPSEAGSGGAGRPEWLSAQVQMSGERFDKKE